MGGFWERGLGNGERAVFCCPLPGEFQERLTISPPVAYSPLPIPQKHPAGSTLSSTSNQEPGGSTPLTLQSPSARRLFPVTHSPKTPRRVHISQRQQPATRGFDSAHPAIPPARRLFPVAHSPKTPRRVHIIQHQQPGTRGFDSAHPAIPPAAHCPLPASTQDALISPIT